MNSTMRSETTSEPLIGPPVAPVSVTSAAPSPADWESYRFRSSASIGFVNATRKPVLVGVTSVKARNVSANPSVALHWQVTEVGDGVELWGTAIVHDDVETKRRLWDGVFDYDLDAFSPGGPDNSPQTGFLAITPTRALVLRQYGMGGMHRWSA